MRILGVDAGNKESTVALVTDGRLVAATAQERFSRVRFDNALPTSAIAAVLADKQLNIDDIDVITGNVDADRVRAALAGQRCVQPEFPGRADGPERFGWHHLSHATFAWLTSGFAAAVVVTIDNHGDDDTLVVFEAGAAGLTRLGAVRWQPVPIGGVYEDATALLGFGQGGEGKLMGLAGYGTVDPTAVGAILRRSGEWTVQSELLSAPDHPLREHLRAPWAPLRRPEHEVFAANVQAALEQTVLPFIADAVAATGISDICLAGGVALNCSLNGAVAAQPWAGRVHVPPSPADPGNAAGSALLWAARAGASRPSPLYDGGLGVAYDAAGWLERLRGDGRFDCEVVGDAASAAVSQRAAADIAEGRIIGWFEGRSEFGPRALGHRSILADPRSESTRDRLNDTKLRERWRPLAPSILAEQRQPWLRQTTFSPFMLLAFDASERMRNDTPAAVHVDGTTRAQTVDARQTAYHGLISAFSQRAGVPLVLNTSFNQAGEPIVETPLDAVDCASRAALDVLWIDGVRLVPRKRISPVDLRPSRPRLVLAGDVGGGWPALLCDQRSLRADLHVNPEGVAARARMVLGLAPNTIQPSAAEPASATTPILWTSEPAQADLHAKRCGSATPLILPGPTSALDLPSWPSAWVATTPTLTGEGVQAVRRSCRPDRLGTPTILQVVMPAQLPRYLPKSYAQSGWRRAWWQLSDGLALASFLLNEPVGGVVIRGDRLDAVSLAACSASGCAVEVLQGDKGPLPTIRTTHQAGHTSLRADGRFELGAERRGKMETRSADTSRDLRRFFAAVAAFLADGTWPHAPDLLHRSGTIVDEALCDWARLRWTNPGQWSADERHKALHGLPRTPSWTLRELTTSPTTSPSASPSASRSASPSAALPRSATAEGHAAVGTLASIALRLVGCASGVRLAASYENATAQSAAAITELCGALGLVAARGPSYHSAVTTQGGDGDQFTLFVAAKTSIAGVVSDATVALRAAKDSEDRVHLNRELGRLYGYPDCCVRAWSRWQKMGLGGSFTHAIAAGTTGSWLAGANVRPPARTADFLPCSFACSAAHSWAETLVRQVRELWPRVTSAMRGSQALREHPAWPGLRDALNAGPDDFVATLKRQLGAPLLYLDNTRYAAMVDARELLTSHDLIGAGQTDDEATLQLEWASALATVFGTRELSEWRLRDAAAGGSEQLIEMSSRTTSLLGRRAELVVPAGRLMVLPFERWL